MMRCPACPVMLQPLEPSTSYVHKAMDHARACGVTELPIHGPAVLQWASLVSHHMTVHPQLELVSYLEAYLDS